jgi:hypothetical protein
VAIFKKTLATLALPALVSLSLVSPIASAQISFSDNFNNRAILDATVGGNWTWYDTGYDADCASNPTGGYGPYSDGDGSDYVASNQNYAREGDAGTYYRAGLQGADNAALLEVYDNPFGGDACNEIKIFQEFSGGAPGDYTFTATVIGNQYRAMQGSVGVFMKVLNVDDGYSEAQFVKQAVTAPSWDTAAATVTFNFTVNSDVSNRIVQVGMYAQHAAGETASAIWDDVAIAVAASDDSGSSPGSDPASIPVLPLWALFGLASLIGLMGLRRKS